MESVNAQDPTYLPVGQDEAERLLRDARDRVVAQVGTLVSAMLETLSAELRNRIDTCASAEERRPLQRALIASTSERQRVESAFLGAYLEAFDRALSEQDLTQTGAFSLEQLSLVEDLEMEEDLLVKRLEAFVNDCCGEEVSNMERRLTAVLARPDIRSRNNPFSPRVFMEAFRDSCRAVIPDAQTRAAFLGAVKKETCQGFQPILAAANAPLAQRVGLPDRRTRPRPGRAEPSGQGSAQTAAAASGQVSSIPTSAAAAPGDWGDQGEFASGDFMARLSQMMMRMPQGASPTADEAATTGFPQLDWGNAGGPAETAAGTGSTVPAQLMSLLGTLQQGLVPEVLRSGQAGVALSPQMLAIGTQNVLQSLRASDVVAAPNSMESLTIDVIAMMFDYIFDDKGIAPEMKGVIGRLQIPLLKVALLDRQFFATRRHPARRLVDRMAELSNHVDPASENGKILFSRLNGIVNKIQHGFEENATIFDESLRQLEDCASSVEAMEQESLAVYTDSIRTAEERELQLQGLRKRVELELPEEALPPAMREFALGPWCAYLLQLRHTVGESSPQWQAAHQTLEDLIWSVRPKRHAGERDLLIRRLPGLTAVIKESLKLSEATPAEQERLLDGFMQIHLAAMRSDPGAAQAIAAATAAPTGATPATTAPGSGGASPAELPVAPPPPRPTLPAAVHQGCWIEFTREGEITKVRLSWISPRRSKFLFTRKGQHAFILTETRLAEALASGQAKLVDEATESLMDRAAAQAFDALEAAAQPASALELPN